MKLSLICERKISIDGETGGMPSRIFVLEDPDPIAVISALRKVASQSLPQLAGWITQHGAWIWDRNDASHYHVANTLKLNIMSDRSIAFYIIPVKDHDGNIINIHFEPSEFSSTVTIEQLLEQPLIKNIQRAWESRYQYVNESIDTIHEMFLAALRLYDCGVILEAPWPQEWSDSISQSPEFVKWLESIGVTGKIGSPMSGGVGRAYPVGDRFIVKFTIDRKEASAAAVMKGHDSPNAAMIYDVKLLKLYPNPMMASGKTELYAIAMERLSTGVGKRYRVAANAVYKYLDYNNRLITDPDQLISTVISKYLPEQYRNDESTISAIHKIVHGLYDIQQRTGVLPQDTHGGNVAFKGREPGFYDFGRSKINWDHPKTDGVKIGSLN